MTRIAAKSPRYGYLHDYQTGEYIRHATKAERDESREAEAMGINGVFGATYKAPHTFCTMVTRSCYVVE